MFKSVQDDFVSAEHALNQALHVELNMKRSRTYDPANSRFFNLEQHAHFSLLDSLIDNQRGILRAKYGVLEAKREQWQLLRAKRKISQRLFLLNVMRISLLTRKESKLA